MLNNN